MRLGHLYLLFAFVPAVYANSGNVPIGRAGVPADGGQTCTSCHAPLASNALRPGRVFLSTLSSYAPGVRGLVDIVIEDTAAQKFGFQLTARLLNQPTQQAGSFRANDQVEVKCTIDPCSSSVQFASHRAAIGPNLTQKGAHFTVQWDPPLTDQGPVVFYATALGANGDGTSNGDRTYSTTFIVAPAGTNFTYFKLDSPGTPTSVGTEVRGLNNGGQAVGSYYQNGKQRAFRRTSAGSVTTFDVGATATIATGINNTGQIVGVADNANGFLRESDGTIQTIAYPGAIATFPYSINDSGVIVGAFQADSSGMLRGFRRDAAGAYTLYEEQPSFIAGAAGSTPQISTELLTVTHDGVILGRSTETRATGGGLFNLRRRAFSIAADGSKTYFYDTTSPGGPIAYAMNASRRVAGTMFDSAFIGSTAGNTTNFNLPGAITTAGYALNDASQVGGSFTDPTGVTGFIVSPCIGSVEPQDRVHGSAAESGRIDVASGCVWYAASNAPWIQIAPADSSGYNNHFVRYQLQANSGPARTGTMQVAGQTIHITQAGSDCSYQVAPQQTNIGLNGGPVTFSVSTGANCPWTATSVSTQTLLLPQSGFGPGSTQATIPDNSETSGVSWHFSVAGQNLVVNQSAAPCRYTLSANGANVAYTGQSGEIIVNTQSNCSWTAASSAPWLTVNSGASGTGVSGIRWTAATNIELTPRSATITAGGQVFVVNQAAAPACTYLTSASSLTLGSAAGSSQFTLVTGSSCLWTAGTPTSWLHVTSALQGQGQAVVTFTADANPGAQRWGTITAGGQTVQIGQQGAAAEGGLRFVPVTPCRLFDTRPGEGLTGAFGPPQLVAGTVREVPVPQSRCGIPGTAVAYSLNVTAVPAAGTLGYLSAVPQGFGGPAVSTLNSWNGRIVANAAIVPAGNSGGIQLFVTDNADVILDINGYYVSRADSTPSLVFYPQTPCRLADSRSARPAPYGQPSLGAAESRTYPILGNASCPVPAQSQAFSLNATVVPQGPLGFLSLWPTGQNQPNVSTLNSSNGTVVANAAIVPAGVTGAINAFVSNAADVILDINGTFGPLNGSNGLHYYPVLPCRVVDTRTGQAPAGTTGSGPLVNASRTFPLAQQCGLPATARAFALNVTVVPVSPLAFLSLWPAGQSQPEVSTLNSFDAQVVANLAIVPAGANGAVSAYALGSTELILDVLGYFAP